MHAMHKVVRVEEMGCDVVDVLAVCLQQPLYHHQLGLTREDAVQLQAVAVRQRVLELLKLLGQLLVQLIDDLKFEQRHGFAKDALQQFGTAREDEDIAISSSAEEVTGSSAMLSPSFFGVEGDEVVNELGCGVLPLIPEQVEPMPEAFLHLVDDELREVLTLEHYRGDHRVNIEGVEQLVLYSQAFSLHLEVVHHLDRHYQDPYDFFDIAHHLCQGVGFLSELPIQVFLHDLALETEVQLAQESLPVGREVMLHLPAEPHVILELADHLFVEVLQLGLEVGDDGLVFDQEGVLERGIAFDELMPHETVVTFTVVNTVGKVKEEVALAYELKKIALSILRRHGVYRRSYLVHTFLRVLVIDQRMIEVIGLVMREGSNGVPQNLLLFQLQSIVVVSLNSTQTDILELAVAECLGEAGEEATSFVLLGAGQTKVIVLAAV